ncbi:hypothetical protein [Bradyrhizobium sp. SZCCHNPS1003]|uniref:hypothetical protein n=1 Tax=Bradyrhizobium sp. SZCCHNPS1003 TaxID=3057330 RepID=UPI0028E3D450|nr:hypothetical protein [Bradyrhizobium sp. SZCCHNPS1003]
MADYTPTEDDLRILQTVEEKGGITVDAFKLAPYRLLEERGLLEGRAVSMDAVLYEITDEGREALEQSARD